MPRRPRLPLAGRVALVTGGARRVGRAIVLALADAGADVVVHAHTSEREAAALARTLRRRGRRAAVLLGDLDDAATCRALPTEAAAALGRLDVLVHSAARFEATDPRSADADAWDRLFSVNARAAWLLTSAAAAPLARTRGNVVHVACASALAPWAGFLPYAASKAAMVALTRGFSKALAPRVRVNAVAPGPVLAPDEPGPWRRRAAAATLLARWGRPADVADAVVYLATAPFVTGVVLPVDGGRSAR
ncbi:MAG: SDR family oxidoreductase [Planctomycetes bacterium]|nr:SDR family oxidoreductase [Planctomycetota bacterium]